MFFPFVQFELTHAIGPPPGRYVLGEEEQPAPDDGVVRGQGAPPPSGYLLGITRGVASADVIVVRLLGAPAARGGLLARRRAREEAASETPREVPLLRASFVRASAPLADRAEAERFIESCRESAEQTEQEVDHALRAVNGMIRAHRAAGPDPYAAELTREDARAIRIGYGGGEEVARGAWLRAIALPPSRSRRVSREERVRPTEELAAALAGRAAVLEGEDLLARVSLDLDQQRSRAAARQLAAAIALLVAELRTRPGDAAAAAAVQLEQMTGRTEQLAARALQGQLGEDDRAAAEELCLSAQHALAAWRLERARGGL